MLSIINRTSESVCVGHPDKIADHISDAVLDFCLKTNASSKVAIETMVTAQGVFIAGETNMLDVLTDDILHSIVCQVLDYAGYTCDVKITNAINQQSSEIQHAVSSGAGDQTTVVGYACDENQYFYPTEAMYAHQVMEQIFMLSKKYQGIHSDAKSQINVNNNDLYITTSVHHSGHIEEYKKIIKDAILDKIPHAKSIIINPAGLFTVGGPNADTGLTGRKLMVDTYGQLLPHGGGAFSGKDPSKLDRSGAYFARCIAKNIVRDGYAKQCMVHLSYMIGRQDPTNISIILDGQYSHDMTARIRNNVDCSVTHIIDFLELYKTEYAINCNFSHFYNKDVSWENKIINY